jgi:hypothetical protein
VPHVSRLRRGSVAITAYWTLTLPFVIPSEADLSRRAVEGSAVPLIS